MAAFNIKYNNDNSNYKNRCRKCYKMTLNNQNCISCTTCNKWFHFKCTKLNLNEFNEHTKNKEKIWECSNCIANKCKKCDKVVTYKQNSICCDLCDKWIHLKCTGLDKITFDKIRKDDSTWICKNCINENIPFSNIDNYKLKRTVNNPKKKDCIKLEHFNKLCSICNNINNGIEKAIPCNICNNLIHRKCSNLNINYIENKLNHDTYMCQVCMDSTFPLSKLIDIKGESFNFN